MSTATEPAVLHSPGLTLAAALVIVFITLASRASAAIDLGGPQVWAPMPWHTVQAGDFAGPNYDAAKNPPSIAIQGVRNGTFSGFVVVSSVAGPINNLSAKISAMTDGNGRTIPAERVLVRYPEIAGQWKCWLPMYRFDGLQSKPPDEVLVVDIRAQRDYTPKFEGPVATQPVWVSVEIPRDAAAGDYRATLTIQSDELDACVIPVNLKVYGWTLPDPLNYTVQNLAFMSPERLAEYYDVPLWSDRHFELMARSFELMLQLGSRELTIIPVAQYPARMNTQGMVRWIKKADGTFDYDFAIVDRMFDTFQKAVGKPFPIRLTMWRGVTADEKSSLTEPQVTVLDQATGELSTMPQPEYGTEASYEFWKPVLDRIRERTDRRGWSDSLTVNWMQYCGGPTPEIVDIVHRIWPDGRWSSRDHGRRTSFKGASGIDVPCIVSSTVWNEGSMSLRGYKKLPGPGVAMSGHARGFHRDSSPLWTVSVICEQLIMKGCTGADPIGGDLFPHPTNARANQGHRWTWAAQGPGNCSRAFLAPGPEGPIVTERFEAFREGVALCEAILYLQKQLDSGKLTPELAATVNKVLDARGQHLMDSFGTESKDPKAHKQFMPDKFAEHAIETRNAIFEAAAAVQSSMGGK